MPLFTELEGESEQIWWSLCC